MQEQEMAAALISKGWRVQPPLTQENCQHIQCSGIGNTKTLTWYCHDCGKVWATDVGAWATDLGALATFAAHQVVPARG
jgi:hypothetical protein